MIIPQVNHLLQTAQQHHQAGRLSDAEAVYRQVLQIEPKHARVMFMLGSIAHQSGNIPGAMEWLAKAIAADPSFAESHFLLGVIHHQRGELEPSIANYRRAISLQPGHFKAMNNLGRALLDVGQVAEGLEMLRRVVLLAPQHASAHSNLGDALRLAKDFDAAVAAYRRAIAINPNFAEAHGNLGAALAEHGNVVEGIASLRKALSINPRLATAHYNLAKALQEQNQFEEATKYCRSFLEMRPDYADGHILLGSLIGLGGQITEAIQSQRQAVALRPNHAASASNLLLSLHYLDEFEPATIFQAHRDWVTRHANRLSTAIAMHNNDRTPVRRIRIGYMSPNFQQHSVAYFVESVLRAHDRAKVEVCCYADLIRPDAVTSRFQSLADHWSDISGQTDAAVADLVRRDSIDILVDLAGHTADNRMLVFARKPAPIQFTWIGYPDTTGLSTMDYRITDAIADPPGESDALHVEKLLRLDGGCWAYAPPDDAPAPATPPSARNGFITFGSFNNLPKVTPRVFETWANILMAVPNSRLLLKALGLSGNTGRNYVLNHLTKNGIDPSRIELLGWTPNTSSHLELYNRIDIALDTFPYNGTTTTCESLWMGVPVIAFPGQMHAGRVGASLLTHAGFPDLLATDVPGYVRRAAELSENAKQLAELRATLRPKFAASPVCDALRVARQLENAYQTAWRTWCAAS